MVPLFGYKPVYVTEEVAVLWHKHRLFLLRQYKGRKGTTRRQTQFPDTLISAKGYVKTKKAAQVFTRSCKARLYPGTAQALFHIIAQRQRWSNFGTRNGGSVPLAFSRLGHQGHQPF